MDNFRIEAETTPRHAAKDKIYLKARKISTRKTIEFKEGKWGKMTKIQGNFSSE